MTLSEMLTRDLVMDSVVCVSHIQVKAFAVDCGEVHMRLRQVSLVNHFRIRFRKLRRSERR